ncbi:MAG: AbrB family transcriptional regulator [Anaerolineales bacterium]|nr:AbrB family transcriptional regulator [Anaerolineales bacterium]
MSFLSDFELARVAVALTLGLIGWLIAARINLPAPAVLGSMLSVAIATMLGVPAPDFPRWLRVLVQSIIGGYLGLKIDRATIASTRSMLIPITISTVWFVAATLLIGYALARWTTIDLYTALLASAPGGVAEMTAIAMAVQANAALVATMQVVRLIASNLAVPFFVRRQAGQRFGPRAESNGDDVSDPTSGLHWIVCLSVGALGGFLFDAFQVPAGGVIGAMLAVAVAQLANVRMRTIPSHLRSLAQMFLGVFVGITFTQQTLIELQSSFVIIVGATLATLVSSFVLARVVQRWMRLDAETALLACAPGGLSLMPMIADELGAQTFVVSLFQLARIVLVILVMPIIFQFLMKF